MTFYNIIFGILFLSAIKEILIAIAGNTGHEWAAATLAMLVFSDVIYTSHLIEHRRVPYTVWMKFIDLWNFLLLTAALVLLHPAEGNVIDVSLQPELAKLFGPEVPEWAFWGILAVYWLGIVLWVYMSGVHLDAVEVRRAVAAYLPRYPAAFHTFATWLIRHYRMLKLYIFVVATIATFATPASNWTVGVVMFAISLASLVFTGIVFEAYDKVPAKNPMQSLPA